MSETENVQEFQAYFDVSRNLVDEEGWESVDTHMIEIVRSKYNIPEDVPVTVRAGRLAFSFEKDSLGEIYPREVPFNSPDAKYYKSALYWVVPNE